MPNKDEIKFMINEYTDWHTKYGDDYKSVGWNKPKHLSRFECLTSYWNIDKNLDIVDVGCGLAHLAEYLKMKHQNFNYTGIDINKTFIETNKQKYPEYSFYSIAADNFLQKGDLIFASGLFNRKFSDSDAFFNKTVKSIINNAKVGCSFNCLSSSAIKKNDHNFYVSLSAIEKIIDRSIIDGFLIDGDTIPGELTVHIRKKILK
mgnify:FL=1|jgi:SAM-dependent methyltransferase